MKFTAEQFEPSNISLIEKKRAASIAQTLFDAWLDQQSVVYGQFPRDHTWTENRSGIKTHRARLVCIEEIQECEHMVAAHRWGNGAWRLAEELICGKCGVLLKPPSKWEAETT